MVIQGATINFDDEGDFVNMMDVGWIEQMVVAATHKQGIDLTPHLHQPMSQHYCANTLFNKHFFFYGGSGRDTGIQFK